MPMLPFFAAAVGFATMLALTRYAAADPGDLDASFGSGGVVVTDLGSVDEAFALARQPDGKLVVAGSKLIGYFPPEIPPLRDIAVARYDADGNLDPTFGTGGVVTTAGGSYTHEDARAVLIQPDGKIVVGGAPLIVRYEADGTLDTSFGSGGMVWAGSVTALVLLPDGKIVAASVVEGDYFDIHLARYAANGSLDPSFGTGGVVTTPIGTGTYEVPFALVLQPDGKLVVAGYTEAPDRDFALVRYEADGSLDAGFGTGGIVIAPSAPGYDTAFALALQLDGKLVAAGTILGVMALARYETDGSLDPSFGSGGVVSTTIGGSFESAQGLVALPNGKLVAAGFTQSPDAIALVAYQSDGSLDAGFGTGGIVTTPVGVSAEAAAILRQPDGQLVVAGTANVDGSHDDFVLARYDGPASLAASLCGTLPASGCRASTLPGKGQVTIKDRTSDKGDGFSWSWGAGAATDLLAFGAPAATTSYAACVYAETGGIPSLVLAAGIPAAGICGGGKPCWKPTTRGFKFVDKDGSPEGVVSLTLQAGLDGQAKIKLKAKGVKLPTPVLPLAQDPTVTVQLRNDLGECWDSHLAAPALKTSAQDFKDKGQ